MLAATATVTFGFELADSLQLTKARIERKSKHLKDILIMRIKNTL
ncbi:hypothetical protein ACOKFD_11170 [Flagellimonas sp. S174]